MERIIGLLQRNVWVGPLVVALVLVVGLGVGLSIGWLTVDFKPSADDVVAAADSYAFNQNADLAKARLKGLTKLEQERMLNQLISDRMAKNRPLEADHLRMLGQALGVNVSGAAAATLAPGTLAPTLPAATRAPGTVTAPTATRAPGTATTQPLGGIDPLIAILLILLVIVLIAAAALIFYLRILPTLRTPRIPRTVAQAIPSTPAMMPVQDVRPSVSPAPTTTPDGLDRYVLTYNLGDDKFDVAQSIKTPRKELAGETGLGISEKIGEGSPDKVTAFDLWLFEKPRVQTETRVLMSEFGYKDLTLRSKVARKGEPILAEKGKTIYVETQGLAIEAHINELVYATHPNLPPNSHFQKLVVEIVPKLK